MSFRLLYFAVILCSISCVVYADEGMWLLPLVKELNMERMEEMGFELSADDIYSINQSSLKDVVGALDYGSCTAELVSDEGLILTNHHCAEGEIQNHTTTEHNYLRDGFWAASRQEELPNPGKTISFIVRMEDVTDRVLSMVHHEMTEAEREESIGELSRAIVNEALDGNRYEAVVTPFYGGNDYYLVVMETFRDIRLVGAPPESIGRFGFDTDNWEWPRHNADFSLMRIYTDPDGNPADYNIENVPYNPERSLPISLEGYHENDFAMILGFPGRTNRYVSSERVQEIMEIENTNRIRIRSRALDLMMEEMLVNDLIRIQYSSKYSTLSNYYKYSIGQNLSIKNLGVIERRQEQEKAMLEWMSLDSSRILQYGNILEDISEVIEERHDMENALSFIEEIFLLHKATELIGFAGEARSLYFHGLGYTSSGINKKEIVAELEERGKLFFTDFNAELDKRIAVEMIGLFSDHVDPLYYPFFYSTLMGEYDGDIQDFMDDVYKKSFFSDPVAFQRFIKKSRFRKLKKDPAFQLSLSVLNTYINIIYEYEELNKKLQLAERKYISALREMYPDSTFYPNANSTLRLTYGVIGGYQGMDAVYYDYQTTLSGMIEKEDPDSREFFIPEKLKQLFITRSFGPWVQDNTMPVCFLTNNDTTGGNSGSPVLNARGELIGLVFDGNWEAMSGEMIYEKDIQRSICVDIRYILFLMDKYGEADHLIEEMNILGRE